MNGTDAMLAVLAAAAVAVVTVIWAALLVRRAVRDRERIRRALVRLGGGHLSTRLDEENVDPHLATAFNQAARDLEERVEATEEAGSHLRSLFAALGDQVLLDLDEAGEVREVLGDIASLTGHRPAAVTGRHASFFFASEDSWAQMEERAGTGDLESVTVALRRRDGEIVEGGAAVRKISRGYVLILSRVAPRQVEVEEARRDSDRLLSFLAALPDAVAILVDGCIASANDRFCHLVGLPAEELRGQPLARFVAPRDLVRVTGLLADRSADGADMDLDLTLQTPSGNELTLAVRTGRAEIEGQRVVLLAAREVGARRDLQRRLAHYSAWLGATLEASREGLAVLASPTGRGAWPVVIANKRFLEALGLSPDRLPGQDDLRGAMQRTFADPEMVWAFLAGFETEPEASGEGLFETREDARMLRIESTPVHSGQTEGPVGRLLAIRDVTGQSRLEDDLRGEIRELKATADVLETSSNTLQDTAEKAQAQIEELTRLNRELKELDEMKSNLLGNVSHELQTPLVSIKGYTEMMLGGDLGAITAEQRQGLEVSRRNIQRLIGLIDQLQTFARTEERLTELTLEAFPLWEVIEETINLLGDRIKAKSLRVTTRYRTDQLTVMADRDLISQVVINLLGNAIKFNREGGEVAISVRASTPEELVVEVRDTGTGIAREDHERIFERGFRGAAAAGTGGSGIGLSVVREILDRHGCQIRVDSRPNEGATLSFTLPLASTEPEPGEATGRAEPVR